jgi:dihydrodipicolinate synthase/N-acetylneuraminate lyase
LYDWAEAKDGARLAAGQKQLLEVARLYAGSRLGQTYGRLKAALHLWDLCEPYVLPPLVTPSQAEQEAVRGAVREWLSLQPERLN